MSPAARPRAQPAHACGIVFGNMRDDDLDAVFAYLRSRHPVNHNVSNTDPPSLCPACKQQHGLGDRNRPKMSDAVPVDPRPFAEYAGRYRFPDFNVDIASDGKNLRVQVQGGGPS